MNQVIPDIAQHILGDLNMNDFAVPSHSAAADERMKTAFIGPALDKCAPSCVLGGRHDLLRCKGKLSPAIPFTYSIHLDK